jgi:epoxyqueuosine reductase
VTGGGLSSRILERCRDLGFALAGVAPVRPTDRERELRDWVAQGKHGTMGWLADRLEERVDARRVLEGARSVVMVGDQYWGRDAEGGGEEVRPGTGRLARYARGRDYHDAMKRRLIRLADEIRDLRPDAATRVFVDTAPVLEREHALRAGLGWIGKHTLLIHPDRGSYLFLGGVLTTLELPAPEGQRPVDDHCGTCTRCLDACPTDAITPYAVDATRCVSYLTIEHRGAIDPTLFAGMGGWLFGCDVCQEVCPHNSPRPGAEPHEAYSPARAAFDLLDVLGWTEDDRRAALRGTAMRRAKLPMWKRNALIALGNEGGHGDDLRRAADDASHDPLVRQTAREVLRRDRPGA